MSIKLNGGGALPNKLLQSNNFGFIGTDPDILYKFSNGKYKQFEGTEIVAENCVKAKVKDLVVEGKTYQNLFKAELNQGHADSTLISNKTLRVNSEGFNLPVKNFTISVPAGFEILVYPNYVNNASGFSPWKNKIVWSNSSETNNIRIMIRKSDESNITVDEVIGKIILLKGDYTDTDLPTSIDGIESVAEREKNMLSIKVNDNTTTLNLPIPLRSLPNGTCDTIEGNKLVQRVGKVVFDGSQTINKSTIGYHEKVIRVQWKNTNLKIGHNNSYCDKFSYENNDNDVQHYKLGSAINTVFLYIPIEYTNNINSYFKENPTTLYYELIEPIIYDIEVISISTTKGTNVITTTNNIKPKLSMKVKVKK